MKKIILVIMILSSAFCIKAQESCYQGLLNVAIKQYDVGKYEEALKNLTTAKKICSDANVQVLDEWIRKSNNKITERDNKDSDEDGIPDKKDKCPYGYGYKRYNGCPIPDKDGDGFNDEIDDCPDTYSTVNNGCLEKKTSVVYTLIKVDTVLIRNVWTYQFMSNDSVASVVKPSVNYSFDNLRNAMWLRKTYSKNGSIFYLIKNIGTGHSLLFDYCASHPNKDHVFLFNTSSPDYADDAYQIYLEPVTLNSKAVWHITGHCKTFLHIEHRLSRVECGDIDSGWWSALWEFMSPDQYYSSTYESVGSCIDYNRKYISDIQKKYPSQSGNLKIIANYGGCYKINLFHVLAPDKVQNTYEICNTNGQVDFKEFKNGNYWVSYDWGIQIVFGNGVKSCIYPIAQVGKFEGGFFYIKATDIFNGSVAK